MLAVSSSPYHARRQSAPLDASIVEVWSVSFHGCGVDRKPSSTLATFLQSIYRLPLTALTIHDRTPGAFPDDTFLNIPTSAIEIYLHLWTGKLVDRL